MGKILIVDNFKPDAERFRTILAREGAEVELCYSGAEAERVIRDPGQDLAAAIVLWEIPGPPFGFDLLALCRQHWSAIPVVVASGTLDATLATRAYALGARDFLEKPLDSERVRSCLQNLLAEQNPLSPLVLQLRKTILGDSPALLETLKQVARVIPHTDLRVLLIGESGTGKELIAQAIHRLGPRAEHPLIAVNVGEIPPTLIESQLFGHEKGAFTDANERHAGFFEQAGQGTLFLDEIGDLELSLQGKLLRVIQEREFRRIKGVRALPFKARLICATNRDLAVAVNQETFRRDLYHRIAEVSVQIPPLHERKGDVDLLLEYFLQMYQGEHAVRIARETLTILRSYPFPGNIRELENLVKAALIDRDDETILPQHLPLRSMAAFLAPARESAGPDNAVSEKESLLHQSLFEQIIQSLPENWVNLPYREAAQAYTRAFDRVYLQHKLERWQHNVTRAATDAGIDVKTFRKRWKESGLPTLRGEVEDEPDV
jgi:DNA-binding NtrC family response regulator